MRKRKLFYLGLVVLLGSFLSPADAQRPRRPREFFTALNNVNKADEFPGADAGEQIASCIFDLPGTGGICDARGFQGNQVISADPFVGLTKDIHLILGTARFLITADVVFPERLVLEMSKGSILAPSGGATVTISGPFLAPESQVFTTAGTIEFDPPPPFLSPFWWGAHGDGVRDDSAALQAAIDSVGDISVTRRGGATIDISAPHAISSTLLIQRKSIILQGHGFGDDSTSSPAGSSYLKWIGTRSSATIDSAPTGASRTSNVTTITTTAAHGFVQSNIVTIAGVTDTSFNGTFVIASVPLTTTFTYAQVDSNATSGSGSASTGTPMVRIQDTQGGAGVRDLAFIGDATNPPEAGISFFETNDLVSNSRNFVENVEIGKVGSSGTFDTGIRFHGEANINNDRHRLTSVRITGCNESGIRVGNAQNTDLLFNQINIQNCKIGILNAGKISGSVWFFASSTVADLFFPLVNEIGAGTPNGEFRIVFFDSEDSARMAEMPGPGILDIEGGKWQLSNSTNADGEVIAAQSNVNHIVSLRNFQFATTGTPPASFLNIQTGVGGATDKTIILDGIRGWANLTGGTNGMSAATHGSTDRSFVYLRRIFEGSGSAVLPIARAHRAGVAGIIEWDINRYEPEGPRLTFRFDLPFTDLDTIPTVADGNWFRASNTGPTTITFFDDGVDGQVIYLLFTNANTTLQDGATLNLSGGINFTPNGDDIVTLIFDGVEWYEVSRSQN